MAQPVRRRLRRTGVVLVLAGVVLAAVGLTVSLLGGAEGSGPHVGATTTTDHGLPAARIAPDGLGSDPFLDALATSCHAGDMRSCDRLYDRAGTGSDYETYGDTCAGRQPVGTFRFCGDAFPDG